MLTYAPLLAAFGLGSVVAAVIARITVISGFREAWINALRDDFAEVLKLCQIVQSHAALRQIAIKDGDHGTAKEHFLVALNAQHATQFALFRIMTRLNRSNPLHARLTATLTVVASVQPDTALNPQSIAAAVIAAEAVFKREWEVTKWGMFAGFMTRAKWHWRLMFD